MRGLSPWPCFVFLALVVLLIPLSARGAANPPAILHSGNLSIAVNRLGNIGMDDVNGTHSQTCDPGPSGASPSFYPTPKGTVRTVRFLPSQDDMGDCDMEGETWTLSYDHSNVSGGAGGGDLCSGGLPLGFACSYSWSNGVFGSVVPVSFAATQTTAFSVAAVGSLQLEQFFHPLPDSAGVYENDITIRNVGSANATDIRFERAMSYVNTGNQSRLESSNAAHQNGVDGVGSTYEYWSGSDDPAYSANYTRASFFSRPPSALASAFFQPDTMFVNPNPCDYCDWTSCQVQLCYSGYASCRTTCSDVDWRHDPPMIGVANYMFPRGSFDGGTEWHFDIGTLPANASKTLHMFYGGAWTYRAALDDIRAAGVDAYSMARPARQTMACNAVSTTATAATDCQPQGKPWVADGESATFWMGFGNMSKWAPQPVIVVAPGGCGDPVLHLRGVASGATSWNWDFGDGSSSSVQNPDHRYNPGASFLLRLTVTYDPDRNNAATLTVHAPDTDCPPLLDPVPDQVVEVGHSLTPSCFHAFDPDDAPPTLSWTFSGLPNGAVVDASQCLHFTPAPDQVHFYLASVQVCDRHACVRQDFWIDVWAPPAAGVAPPCVDSDHDGICDAADNCPGVPNHDQRDSVGNGVGDACRRTGATRAPRMATAPLRGPSDIDLDGVPDAADNCPVTPNPDQADLDRDGIGDVCDNDIDGDGIVNWAADSQTLLDNCPRVANPDQTDSDHNGVGDACDAPMPRTPRLQTVAGAVPASVVGPAGPAILVIVGAVAALAWAWSKRAGLVVLFSRLSGTDVLVHPTRARIMAQIEAEPGVHFYALLTGLEIGRNGLDHHLAVLVRQGLVKKSESGGRARYYSLQAGTPHERPPQWSARAQRVLEFVALHPGTPIAAVARALKAPRQKISYHARRLEAAGALHILQTGRNVRLYAKRGPRGPNGLDPGSTPAAAAPSAGSPAPLVAQVREEVRPAAKPPRAAPARPDAYR
ncbi:MAG: thrombospondin type 3 repeat-containing protein [Thermoplasmatota archaeon]